MEQIINLFGNINTHTHTHIDTPQRDKDRWLAKSCQNNLTVLLQKSMQPQTRGGGNRKDIFDCSKVFDSVV